MSKSENVLICFKCLMVAVIILFVSASCSTTTQMYSGPERAATAIALIKGADSSIDILRCDGVKLSRNAATVLPGEHTVEATYSDRNYGYLKSSLTLGWKAEAGHTYVVDRQLNVAPGMSSMFIVDLTTGKRVSRGLAKSGEEMARLQMIETKIKEFPQYAEFWTEKGYLLTVLKRFDEAVPAIETALSLKPESASAWWAKSWLFFQQQQYDDALAAIDKTIQFRGNDSDKKAREEILKKIEEKKKTQ